MPNIVGDIAGNYHTFLALIKQMPDEEVISVGDMIDRGPHSKQVLEWFKAHGTAILGNHEHMFLLSRTNPYWFETSLRNGGEPTLKSFFPQLDSKKLRYLEDEQDPFSYYKQCLSYVSEDLFTWLDSLPLYLDREGLFISHGPKNPSLSLEKTCDLERYLPDSLLWNRGTPRRLKDKVQVFGHNSSRSVQEFKDSSGTYAYCIDTSRGKTLTGLHWPSMKIYEQPFIDV